MPLSLISFEPHDNIDQAFEKTNLAIVEVNSITFTLQGIPKQNFAADLPGWVPPSGGGTDNFLRADGMWAAPPGGTGGTISDGNKGDLSITSAGAVWTINASAVTGTKIADATIGNVKFTNMAAAGFKGAAAAGAVSDLTPLQARAILNVADGATANQTDEFLRSRVNHLGTQAIATIDGLGAALDGKAPTSHTHLLSQITRSGANSGQFAMWNGTAWVPADAPAGTGGTTTSGVSSVNGLTGAVTITPAGISAADAVHTHLISDVTGLTDALNGKSPTSHTHATATPTVGGFMSAADKAKSDGIAAGATRNQTDAFLLDLANQTGSLALNKLAPSAATTGQVVKFNGTAWAPAADDGGTMTASQISASLQTLPNKAAHILSMDGVAALGPFVAGDLVQRNGANTGWERVSPGAFTALPNSWQRYDTNSVPYTISSADAVADLESPKHLPTINAPAPIAPAVFSSIAINRTPIMRGVRLIATTANMVLDQQITGINEGETILFYVRQDAVGGRTLSQNHAKIALWGADALSIDLGANVETLLIITGRANGGVRINNTGHTVQF